MMRNYFIALLALVMASCGGNPSGNGIDSLSAETEFVPKFPITINVTQEYPQKTIAYEDLAEVSFVQLERTPDNLLDTYGAAVITREDIFIDDKYCVQRYGLDGKLKNKIGRSGRGPGEVAMFVHQYMVDTVAQEVYLYDNGQQKTVVFSYDGTFKRDLKKVDPVYTGEVEIITPTSLIVKRQLKAWSNRPMEPGELFAEISKEDGHEIRKIGPFISQENGRNLGSIKRSIIRFQNEIIIEHKESDTIYSFKPAAYPNLIFEPRYILTPPHFCTKDISYNVGVLTESEELAFLEFVIYKQAEARIKMKEKSPTDDCIINKTLVVNKGSGEIFDAKFTLDGFVYDRPRSSTIDGLAFTYMPAYRLLERKEKGEIKNPQLLSIAETITEDSNPVLVILNFR